MKYEYCCNCNEPTGKAGAGDDSLYTDNDGPFCEDCFPDKEKPQSEWIGLTENELSQIHNSANWNHDIDWSYERAIEAKLKEKNA